MSAVSTNWPIVLGQDEEGEEGVDQLQEEGRHIEVRGQDNAIVDADTSAGEEVL